MATLHIEHPVRDFDAWKATFDRFEGFREEKAVRALRVSRGVADPNQVLIDLDFDSRDDAVAFSGELEKIWASPQAQEVLVSHSTPVLLDVVEQRTLASA